MSQKHAVIIGGSIAGMSAAQALRAQFDKVTILDQDEFPDVAKGRRGTPQAWHSHLMLDRGRQALDDLFPGFTDYCIDAGGVLIDPGYDAAQCLPGGWYPRARSDARTLFASRPKIETAIRELVNRDAGITFVQNARVSGLMSTPNGAGPRIEGVTYQESSDSEIRELKADFVVDAAGRGSRCARWMKDFGIAIEERNLDAGVTYSSRWHRLPPEGISWWKWLVVFPSVEQDAPPEHQYVCTLFPIEDNCFIATMGSWDQPGGNPMPADGDQFVNTYRRTRSDEFIVALDASEPISDVYRTRSTRNIWRRFDRVANPPAGYVAVGDAVCAFNPIYGQGMTCAASNGVILRDLLSTHDPSSSSFAREFYARQAELLDRPWQLAVTRDGAYSQATGTEVMPDGIKKRLLSKFTWTGFQFLLEAAFEDPVVKEHYERVNNLYESLTDLLGNARVCFGLLRHGLRKMLGRRILLADIPTTTTASIRD